MRQHHYKCDRCETTVEVDAMEVPEGWSALRFDTLPKPLDLGAALAQSLKQPRHLCGSCTTELLEWLGEANLKLVD